MLIDANDLPPNSQLHCDICVAGSGPAGLTIAKVLSRTKISVCLLESGGLHPRSAIASPSVAMDLSPPLGVHKYRKLRFGGGSNLWGGLSGRWFRTRPLDPLDFEKRPWVPNSGWPITYSELAPYYERAGDVLNLTSFDCFDREAHGDLLMPYFPNNDLHTSVFQETKPVRFGVYYRSVLSRSRNLKAYLHAKVVGLEEAQDAPIVTHLTFVATRGAVHQVHAKHFVLACGGLENARLLLASQAKKKSGIGNENDLVGRFLMQHPKGRHGLAILNRNRLPKPFYAVKHRGRTVQFRAGIAFSSALQRRQRLLNHCLMFHSVYAWHEGYASDVYRAIRHRSQRRRDGTQHPGIASRRWLREFASATLGGITSISKQNRGMCFNVISHMEQIPMPDNRVSLTDTRCRFGVPQLRVHWRITSVEKEALCSLHRLVRASLEHHGLGTLQSRLDSSNDDWPIGQDSAHYMGTTRMYDDPRHGVTDRDCRVHGVMNLYMSGSSLFTTSGYANPTLTIVALSLRLADHLKEIHSRGGLLG